MSALSQGQMVEEAGRPFANLATSATTTIKTGPGYLHSITVNTAGTTSTATVYDNTTNSGTKIATIDTTAKGTLTYDLAFSTGLTIVTAGGAAGDLTVTYR